MWCLDRRVKRQSHPLFGMGMGEHSPGSCSGAGRDRQRGLS